MQIFNQTLPIRLSIASPLLTLTRTQGIVVGVSLIALAILSGLAVIFARPLYNRFRPQTPYEKELVQLIRTTPATQPINESMRRFVALKQLTPAQGSAISSLFTEQAFATLFNKVEKQLGERPTIERHDRSVTDYETGVSFFDITYVKKTDKVSGLVMRMINFKFADLNRADGKIPSLRVISDENITRSGKSPLCLTT